MISKKRLTIFVEGVDDQRFFQRLLKPLLEQKYSVRFVKYAQLTKKRVVGHLRSADRTGDYIFVRDLDWVPCYSGRFDSINRQYPFELNRRRFVGVKYEIESWYLAGVTTSWLKEVGASLIDSKNYATKEQFERVCPPGMTPTEFMISLLDQFDLQLGCRNNESLRYFVRRFLDYQRC